MNAPFFNPEMLILARESKGLNQTELASAVSVKQGSISKVEAGLISPSSELLASFASALEFPMEFFSQTDMVYGFNSTVFYHRKRQSLADRVLRKLHAQVNLSRMRVHRLMRSIQIQTDFKFQRMESSEFGGVSAIARLVRQTWMLPPGPVRDLTKAIEDAGGIVIEYDFGTKQADAISEWVPGFPPIFMVNSNSEIPWDRRRLTLAHELGHIILHKFPTPTMEDEANEFAAEFLMPRKEIKPSLYGLTMGKLADLKKIWKVSMQALIERAHQLGTMSDYQRRNFYINMNRSGRSRIHEPLENAFPPEKAEVFVRMVKAHLQDLGFSVRELMEFLFISDEQEFRAAFVGQRQMRLVVG